MARVKYLTRAAAGTSLVPLYERLERERKVPTANIFLALANAPEILDGFLTYANAVRGAKLSPRLRELAILVVGHSTSSEYEIVHHHSHALKAGVSEEQYAAVPDFESSPLFGDAERAVMAFAKESTCNVDVSDKVWNRASEHLSEREMVELAVTVSWYNSGVRIMGALKIELEDNYRTKAAK
jgi:AhpD family alkylhydroperoxidase